MNSPENESRQAMTRSASMFGSVTMLSRVLGLIRDVLSAGLFGTTQVWDAFVTAFTIPNMFRMLLGEGALAGAFVPIFTDYMHNTSQKEAWQFANRVISLVSIVLMCLVITGWIVLGVILKVAIPERIHLIILLSIILLPYLFFICNVGLLMGILNTFYHFFLPAFCPVILNITLISIMLVLLKFMSLSVTTMIYIISVGVLIGGSLQFISHWIMARKKGLRYRFVFDIHDPGVRKVWSLMLPAILGLSINQINLMVDRFLSLVIGAGAVSSLYYSNRLIQLPIGVFGVSLATISFPLLAKYSVAKDMRRFKNTLSHVIQMMLFISVPATCGLMVLSYPITRMIFEHYKFDAVSTANTASALIFYSIGLCAYCCNKVIIRGFYSLKDTSTPVKIGVITLVLNVVLNLVLMGSLKQSGLALSTSISAFAGFILLIHKMNKKVGFFLRGNCKNAIKQILIASVCMMGGVYLAYKYFSYILEKTFFNNLIIGLVPIGIGLAIYLILMYFFKSTELIEVLNMLHLKKITK